MFAKLLKYNLKPILKSILPFIIAFLAVVILFNLTDYDTELIYDEEHHIIGENYPQTTAFFHNIFSFLMSCCLILLIATTIKAIWKRFKTNFYSDEAYLTHTLPISRQTLWNSHVCSMFITFGVVITTLILSCFILLLTKDGARVLDTLGLLGGCSHCLGEYYSVKPLRLEFYLSYILAFLGEFIFLTLCGLTGIILKNRSGKNITLLAGAGLYIIGNCLMLLIFNFIGSLDPEILELFEGMPHRTPGFDFDTSYLTRALFYIGLVYTVYSTILYFVDRKLLQRGVNLD